MGVGRFIQQERQEDHDLENDFFTGDCIYGLRKQETMIVMLHCRLQGLMSKIGKRAKEQPSHGRGNN